MREHPDTSGPESPSVPLRVLLAAVFCLALLLRVLFLDRLPGLNGDEAWYGVWSLELLAGRPLSWTTPTGNAINTFYMGPCVLLHALLPPSVILVRIPALVSGLATVALAVPLLRRSIGTRAARVTAVLLACLPQAIAYSRFGWDSSQIPLASLLLVAAGLARRPTLILMALLAGLLVHPTLVFLAPAALAPHAITALREPGPSWRRRLARAGGPTLGALALVLATLWLLPRARNAMGSDLPGRVLSPELWLSFLAGFERLFSGWTVYTYLAGAPGPLATTAHDVLTSAALLAVGALGARAWIRRGEPVRLAFLAGLVLSALGLFVVAGPEALAPGWERYGLSLLAPSAVAAAILLDGCTPGGRRPLWIAGGAGLALMGSFVAFYLLPLQGTGGAAHRGFRTGAEEPKVAAARLVAEQTGGTAVIVTEDWWSYWPVRYAAVPWPELRVVKLPTLPRPVPDAHLPTVLEPLASGAWLVAFPEGPALEVLERVGVLETGHSWSVPDSAGREALRVWRRAPPPQEAEASSGG